MHHDLPPKWLVLPGKIRAGFGPLRERARASTAVMGDTKPINTSTPNGVLVKPTPGNAIIVLPEPGAERITALRLYAARTDLYVRILDELARRRGVAYNGLLMLLPKGSSKNLLTKALHRLQMDGIVTRRGLGDRAGYELTGHGVAVRDAIVEYRALDRIRLDMPSARPVDAAST